MASVTPAEPTTRSRRRFFGWVAGCALLSVLIRLRFCFSPLTVDEGGFLAIARAWSHGRVLYADVWVDRPQGLLVLFRVWDFVTFGSTQSVRVMAILFGIVAVVAAAVIARCLATPAAGVIAALFVAVMSSAPALEGFIANGELLSGALSVACLAVGCLVVTDRIPLPWMFAAGVLGGLATSVKQSGYDGFLALAAWLAIAFVFGWRDRRVALKSLGYLVGGLLVVWIVMAIHGAITGWDNWTYAIAGYRLEGRSALVGANWDRFWFTWHDARPILLPAVIAATACGIAALVAHGASGLRALHLILPLWLLFGAAAFATGGQFFDHYWITLTFPIAVTSAVIIGSMRLAAARNVIAVAVLLPALFDAGRYITLASDQVPIEIDGDTRLAREQKVADWFHANGERGETIYALCAIASFYAHADEDPPYPYLWLDNVNKARGARSTLQQMFLDADTRPTYVAQFQAFATCDSSGVTERAINEFYMPFTTVDGITILKLVDG